MSADCDPIVGNWYRRQDKGQEFQVIDVDEQDETVELQCFDGTIEVIDFEGWRDLELEMVEAPEDWTGPVDDLQVDDLGYSETNMEKADWVASGHDYPPGREGWELSDDELEDDGEGPPVD